LRVNRVLTHIIAYRIGTQRHLCKTVEPIEMQFGMLRRVGSGNIYYMGMKMPHGNGHF